MVGWGLIRTSCIVYVFTVATHKRIAVKRDYLGRCEPEPNQNQNVMDGSDAGVIGCMVGALSERR
jgi:hypothetical protein